MNTGQDSGAEGRRRRIEHTISTRTFDRIYDGEWIRPPSDTPFLFMCHDCELVHALRFGVTTAGKVVFAAWRVDEAAPGGKGVPLGAFDPEDAPDDVRVL